ncbi:MAG: cobalamin-dependent protein [Spirochaetota bacterium]
MTTTASKSNLPFIAGSGGDLSPLATSFLSALLGGNRREAAHRILKAVETGTSVQEVYLDVFQPVQYLVGELWQTGRIGVAQEHFCSASVQLVMSQLYPRIFSTEKKGRTLVAACVGDELHEIGIRMVADFFELDGWDTYYLGANMPTESILRAVREEEADVAAISVSMAFHIDAVPTLIKEIRASDSEVRILVGGRQFNLSPDLWRRVGADGFAPNAAEAVRVADLMFLPGQGVSAPGALGSAGAPARNETLSLLKSLRQELVAETASAWTARMRTSGVTMDRTEDKMLSGATFMVSTLESVMAVGDLGLLDDQASWTRVHLGSKGLSPGLLSTMLSDYRAIALKRLPRENSAEVLPHISALIHMLGNDGLDA